MSLAIGALGLRTQIESERVGQFQRMPEVRGWDER